MKKLLVVTGVSGSGRTTVMQVLTDEGFVILENLHQRSMESVIKALLDDEGVDNIAVVLNTRNLERFKNKYETIKSFASADVDLKMVLLTAREQVLINRYQEHRKIHPITRENPEISLLEAIQMERNNAEYVLEKVDLVIDTSDLVAKDTKEIMHNFISSKKTNFHLNIRSFGFKYGVPSDSDLVFDVRFLPNPFYIESLRSLSGLDYQVSDYVFSFERANTYYDHMYNLILASLEGYKDEGRLSVNISIGCTGGQHRSVSFVERLKNDLKDVETSVEHLEQKKGNWH